jgi:DNA-binding XRE family transcriptional regulator
MDKYEFAHARARLGKTQAEMAKLLRTSLKAIQSYEQGWRTIPAHAESQTLLLVALKGNRKGKKACWIERKCPPERKRQCPAWEFKAGTFCWFISGTMCEGKPQHGWKDKMKICRSCSLMISLLQSE